MTNNELEELIYEYGHLQYRLGRMETDERSSSKEYNKTLAEKDKIVEKFNVYFKVSKKTMKI